MSEVGQYLRWFEPQYEDPNSFAVQPASDFGALASRLSYIFAVLMQRTSGRHKLTCVTCEAINKLPTDPNLQTSSCQGFIQGYRSLTNSLMQTS